MIDRGMTLEQVKAARPTLDYDDRYRSVDGAWTTDMFVEAAYRTHMRAGYLRKNGAPYSENMVMTEYFDRHAAPDGNQWLTVMAVIGDPRYLSQPFILTTSFKKEPDNAKWRPTPCETVPPAK